MTPQQRIATRLGAGVRRARIDARLRQIDVATRADVSQSLVCRIETGRGASIPIGTWARVAEAAGLDLATMLGSTQAIDPASPERRALALLADIATAGAWWPSMLVGAGVARLVLVRSATRECVVAHLWRDVGDVDAAIADLRDHADDERFTRGSAWHVRCLVFAPVTSRDRRRWTERREDIDEAFPEFGARWMASLRNPDVRMPRRDGLLWIDRAGTRIRPTILAIDRRPRRRGRRGG